MTIHYVDWQSVADRECCAAVLVVWQYTLLTGRVWQRERVLWCSVGSVAIHYIDWQSVADRECCAAVLVVWQYTLLTGRVWQAESAVLRCW